jgi:hypothetical protein
VTGRIKKLKYVEREITPAQAVEGQSVGLASVLVERD